MKRVLDLLTVFLVCGILCIISCGGGGSHASSTNGTSTGGTSQLGPIVNYGSLSLARQSSASSLNSVVKNLARYVSKSTTTASFAAPYFWAGQDANGLTGLVYVMPDGTTTPPTKSVVLNDRIDLPSAYPNNFVLNGTSYLLFSNDPKGSSPNAFYLYSEVSETSTQLSFNADTTFDFTAVNAFNNGFVYNGSRTGWASSPVYSVVRKTLYYTFSWWVSDSVIGNYVTCRIFQSTLGSDGKTFGTPTQIGGAMDPFSGTHYKDGNARTQDGLGTGYLWWIGRLYMTSDGTKAYFTVLNINSDPNGIMNAGDPFIAPTPNSKSFGSSGITSIYDPRCIRNYLCSADVDTSGNFSNIQQLSSTVNTGGINFVSDISDDGSVIVVSHMDLDKTFYTSGYGSDGITSDLLNMAPWDISTWNGYGIVYENVSGTWTQLYSTGQQSSQITEVSATPVSTTGILISWPAVSGATSYNVYRSTSSTFTQSNTVLVASGTNINFYIDNSSLAVGTTYYYGVTSVISGTETSVSSSPVSASPAPYIAATVLVNASDGSPFKESVTIQPNEFAYTSPITNATVTINGTSAPYQSSSGTYSCSLTIAPGAQITVSVTLNGVTYTATATQFSSSPVITAPTSGATWNHTVDNSITWNAATLTTGAKCLVGVATSNLSTFPYGCYGRPLYVSPNILTVTVPANTLTSAGSYTVLYEFLGTTSIPNATYGSRITFGTINDVPITVQ
jgi:hypothetical protein